MPRLNPADETQPEPQRPVPQGPPGQFVSDDFESDCLRFLEEIKDVVRRRSEMGLGPHR